MDEFENDPIPEGSHEAEPKAAGDQSPVSVKEADDGNQRKSDQEPALDSAAETESAVPLPEGSTEAAKEPTVEVDVTTESKAEQALDDGINGVSPAANDSVSVPKEANSFPEADNGVSSIDKEPNKNNGDSSVVRTEPTMVPDSAGAGSADPAQKQAVENASQPAEAGSVVVDAGIQASGGSTEDEPFMAVTGILAQRTSWWGCCGLFHILRRSDD